jgi:hypothetical protein
MRFWCGPWSPPVGPTRPPEPKASKERKPCYRVEGDCKIIVYDGYSFNLLIKHCVLAAPPNDLVVRDLAQLVITDISPEWCTWSCLQFRPREIYSWPPVAMINRKTGLAEYLNERDEQIDRYLSEPGWVEGEPDSSLLK